MVKKAKWHSGVLDKEVIATVLSESGNYFKLELQNGDLIRKKKIWFKRFVLNLLTLFFLFVLLV